jgi:aerobic carbon-monoxide dehydrogenase large subunit
VTIDPSGKVTVAVSVSSHGQGHETSLAQVVADALGADLFDMVVVHGDTAVAPYGRGTGASRSAVVGAGTCTLAAQAVRAKLLEVAAALLEVSPMDLDVRDSHIFVRGASHPALTFGQVAAAAYFDADARRAEPLLSATRFYDPPPAYADGCYAALVEVEPETGRVRVLLTFDAYGQATAATFLDYAQPRATGVPPIGGTTCPRARPAQLAA